MYSPITNTQINTQPETNINGYYIGHVFSTMSTIPNKYLFWYKKPSIKTLTITGESKAQRLKQLKSSILQCNLESACIIGVELHCSGYLLDIINIIIEIIGSHIHIHNISLSKRLYERYIRFKNQINISEEGGTLNFPGVNETDFFSKPEILNLKKTLNCQLIRNFVIEIISSVTLSHQKEMILPKINKTDIEYNYLYKSAKSLNIGGSNISNLIKKNELKVVLSIINKYLSNKIPKIEEAIFWVEWLFQFESKLKRKGEQLPCKKLDISGISKKESDHWIWYIWKDLFKVLKKFDVLKRRQIINIYNIFKIDFTKKKVSSRKLLLYFSIRLLNYNSYHTFPTILNNIHLYIQAYSNNNTLYRNLQIKLSKRSWIDIVGQDNISKKEPQKISKKISKTMKKKLENDRKITSLNRKTAYLDIIPKANNVF